MLTSSWTELSREVPEQRRLWKSKARFRVIEAGRRSGKTEIPTRYCIREALRTDLTGFRAALCAPTRDQAKLIYWERIKGLIPPWAVRRTFASDLHIVLHNGASIYVVGMDRPQRIEGSPLHWAGLDEFAHYRDGAWDETIRPALSTPSEEGSAWVYGVPRPSRQFSRLVSMAQSPEHPDWEYFHWVSADVLDPAEVAAARAELDPLTFAQEYEATRVNLAGRAYYAFTRLEHANAALDYDPSRRIDICFDFNVRPGVACLVQEMTHPTYGLVDGCIGEVWIPTYSNTPAVCEALIRGWGKHEGPVYIYGDASGGAAGTSQTEGSDWDQIRERLGKVFGNRLHFRVPLANPKIRARVNAMNARFKSADGKVHMIVDPVKCPSLVEDLELTMVLEATGEPNKKHDPQRTHITDALGYRQVAMYPTTKHVVVSEEI